MDRFVKRWDAVQDRDLMICEHRGVAYQRSMKADRVEYDQAYFDKVAAYEGNDIAEAVNAGRCALMLAYLPAGTSVLDVGAGTGAFVRAANAVGFDAKGFDVMPQAEAHLRHAVLFADDVGAVDAVTFWDSIEHMEDPEIRLKRIRRGAHVFVSLPVFEDLSHIRESKHYRPGEHLYYWTPEGFVNWMEMYGFRLLAGSDHEIEAGRENIGAFVFVRDFPDYHDHIAQYQELHNTKHYGSSASELHLQDAAMVVKKLLPRTILDYGCGRSDLAAYFWLDGRRKIAKFDPAIVQFKDFPEGIFDLVFCCDVMEHIPYAAVDRVLAELKSKSKVVFFTISMKLARAKLPDGRNAHVTILTRGEWVRWISSVFGPVQEIPSKWEHELVLLAGAQVKL